MALERAKNKSFLLKEVLCLDRKIIIADLRTCTPILTLIGGCIVGFTATVPSLAKLSTVGAREL